MPTLALLALMAGGTAAAPAVRGVFGFSPELFPGLTAAEAAARLKAWGITAVWISELDDRYGNALARAGIQVYLDMACFQGEKHWKKRPESRPVNERGERILAEGWYAGVCPSQSWLRKRILGRVSYAARRRWLSGIWLDFIRYPVHWEVPRPRRERTCFCEACLDKFQAEARVRIPGALKGPAARAEWILRENRAAWNAWRARNIAGFVREVRETAQGENPRSLIGAFMLPWSQAEGLGEIAGQDYALMSPWVDVFSPMVYYPLVGRPRSWMVSALSEARERGGGRPVWPVLYAGEPGRPVPANALAADVELAGAPPAGGVILLSLTELLRREMLPVLAPTLLK